MRTKKLFIGLLVGAILFNTTSLKSLAAEETTLVNETAAVQAEATLEQNTIQAEVETNEKINSEVSKEDYKLEIQTIKESKEKVKETKKQEIKQKQENKTKAIKVKSVKSVKEKKASYSKSDLKYLACLIYTESGNQSRTGKIAVGNVVLNRVKSTSYKDTIYGVIYQPSQFGVVRNGSFSAAISRYESGKFDSKSEKASIEAAKAALEGENIIGKRLSFTRYSSSLAKRHPSGVKIQDHYFY